MLQRNLGTGQVRGVTEPGQKQLILDNENTIRTCYHLGSDHITPADYWCADLYSMEHGTCCVLVIIVSVDWQSK